MWVVSKIILYNPPKNLTDVQTQDGLDTCKMSCKTLQVVGYGNTCKILSTTLEHTRQFV